MQAAHIYLRIRGRSGADRRRRLAGSPIRRQPPRRQHQSRADAAAGRDRRRRRRRPPAAGAGAARQHRTSADDRRPDRHRRGTQYRARHAGTRSDAAAAPVGGAELPPRIAPLPDAGTGPTATGRPTSSIMPSRKCPSRRRGRPGLPSPTKCAARATGAAGTAQRAHDPLAGFTPEPLGGRPEPRPEHARAEPLRAVAPRTPPQ